MTTTSASCSKALDDLGIADNTIVDLHDRQRAEPVPWPDAATTPFRSEKDTNWEGAFRVPAMIRWPGHIKPGEVSNEMVSGLDWFPTLLAAAGDTTIKERLLKGWAARRQRTTFKVPPRRLQPARLPRRARTEESPRNEFYYFDDDGDLVAIRYEQLEGRVLRAARPGRLRRSGTNPFTCLRVPKIFNLRMDPYERADVVSDQYYDWLAKNDYIMQYTLLPGPAVPRRA